MDRLDRKLIAANVRHLRMQLDMSREQVAEYVGISPSSVGMLERGEGSAPGSETLFNLAALLGVPPGDLGQKDLTKVSVFDQIVDQMRVSWGDEGDVFIGGAIRLIHKRGRRGLFRPTPRGSATSSSRAKSGRHASS